MIIYIHQYVSITFCLEQSTILDLLFDSHCVMGPDFNHEPICIVTCLYVFLGYGFLRQLAGLGWLQTICKALLFMYKKTILNVDFLTFIFLYIHIFILISYLGPQHFFYLHHIIESAKLDLKAFERVKDHYKIEYYKLFPLWFFSWAIDVP